VVKNGQGLINTHTSKGEKVHRIRKTCTKTYKNETHESRAIKTILNSLFVGTKIEFSNFQSVTTSESSIRKV